MKTSTSYYSFWFFLLFRSSSSSLAMPKVARFFLKSFNVKSAAKTSRKVSLLSTSFSRQKDFQEDSITTFTTSKEIGTLLYFGYGVTFMWVVMYTVWKLRKFTLTLLWCKSVNIPTVPKYTEDAAAIASVEPSMVPAKVSPLIFAPSAVRALTVLTLDFRANKDPIVFSTLENPVHNLFICVSDTSAIIV